MLILISCAKIMRECFGFSHFLENYSRDFSEPQFSANALELAEYIAQLDVALLADNLKVNDQIAQQNYMRYKQFATGENSLWAAIFSYHGIVFKNIDPENFSYDDMIYAQDHLLITSFLYGLLRPLDLIEHYRLEGKFKINIEGSRTIFGYWRTRLTEVLIEAVKARGGVLCNLASREMQDLFDWKRVCQEVEVVSPEFFVEKDSKLKQIVVYTKIARGLMTNFIIKNRIENPEDLRGFCDNGYRVVDNSYTYVLDLKSADKA